MLSGRLAHPSQISIPSHPSDRGESRELSAIRLCRESARPKGLRSGGIAVVYHMPVITLAMISVVPSTANSGHSRYKENPAGAGFLNGDFRPEADIGNIAANSEILLIQ